MLTKLEATRRLLAGKHKAVDDWLQARQTLLVQYMRLAGLEPVRRHHLPSPEEVSDFCQLLMDYVSAGHFEIYDLVVVAFEQASGRSLSLAKRLIPRIEANTEALLKFNDRYAEASDEALIALDEDLNAMGPLLEERFRLEDRLVTALRLLDMLLPAA